MKFSDQLWQKAAPIYQRILDHAFIKELASGELDFEKFKYYMEQDSLYLIEFSKALALIAGRLNSPVDIQRFLHFSFGALIAERELHAHFVSISEPFEWSPTCLSYTSYLLATAATASVEEAIAVVLPCFWIYREVGEYIASKTSENNPYALWIATYSSPEFWESTEKMINLFDKAAEQTSDKGRKLMETAFENSALFEWHFWNDAHNMETLKNSVFRLEPAVLPL